MEGEELERVQHTFFFSQVLYKSTNSEIGRSRTIAFSQLRIDDEAIALTLTSVVDVFGDAKGGRKIGRAHV